MTTTITLKDLEGNYDTLLSAHCTLTFKKRLFSRTEIDDSAIEHQYIVAIWRSHKANEVKFGRNFSKALAFYNQLDR